MSSPRNRIWRNTMVAAINAGLEQGLFGLGVEQNYWLDRFETEQRESFVYHFNLCDIPATASVSDIGYGELAIHAAFWPTPPRYFSAPKVRGLVEARGWFERLDGTYLQSAIERFKARPGLAALIRDLSVVPLGYEDNGPLR